MQNDNLEMTLEEAIDKIKWTSLYRYECDFEKEKQSDLFKALELAIETMEKQIPQKPKYIPVDCDGVYREYICPTCGEWLFKKTKRQYCLCGQKLDWSDEK